MGLDPAGVVEGSEARLAALIRSSSDAVVGADPDGRITLWNPAAEALFGFTHGEVLGQRVSVIIPPERAEEHERLFALVRGGGSFEDMLTERLHRTGRRVPVYLSVSPVVEDDGELLGFAAFLRDATARFAAEEERHVESLRALNRAAVAINRALGVEELLEVVAREAADILEAAHVVVTAGPEAATAPDAGAPAAVATVALGDDPPQDVTEWVEVDLLDRAGERIGGIAAGSAAGSPSPSPRKEALLAQLAQLAAAALEKSQLLERDHTIAVTLQRSLMPDRLPVVPGVLVDVRYLPAASEAEVGGDWYDALLAPDGTLVVAIGDVVGHGIRAAATMGQLRNALRSATLVGLGPAASLAHLDRFAQDAGDTMATVCVLHLDVVSGRMSAALAGHPPPLVCGSGGAAFVDVDPGPPVGTGTLGYVDHVLELTRGDVVLLYTDGLVERRGDDLDAGLARLRAAVGTCPGSVVDDLDALVDDVAGPERTDDIAVLVLRFAGRDGA